ncbi:helix-turn-helix domain-containing protein [Paraburkholderia mimosarum]|uniref:AraC-like ligand-binding domain-containing protein n=1 Tax=Paraburkholderia mimosarum TaxID=312026 RepID=UPI0039C27224
MNFSYSTAEVTAGHRLDYWAECVCKQLIPASASFATRADFSGALSGHSLGSLTVCHMNSTDHTFLRTERNIRATPNEDFVALMVRSGTATMIQDCREVELGGGDIVLCDAARPFINGLMSDSIYLLRIPRAHLLSRFEGAERMMAVRIAQGTAMARLLHEMVEEAYKWQGHSGCAAAEARLASALVDTLTAAMEVQATGSSREPASRYDALFDRADNYIRGHLDDGTLTSVDIALALHVSNRTLIRAFASRNTTVMHHVWQKRLDASFSILTERRVQQVSQAALQCGFNNLAHFSRAFRKAFGTTPGSLLHGDAG